MAAKTPPTSATEEPEAAGWAGSSAEIAKWSMRRSPADRSPAPVGAEDAEELDAVDGVDGAVEDVEEEVAEFTGTEDACAAARWSAAPGLLSTGSSVVPCPAGSSPPMSAVGSEEDGDAGTGTEEAKSASLA